MSLLKPAIEQGNVTELTRLLADEPSLANRKIHWDGKNQSDPLHYLCDCVFNKRLTNGTEAQMAKILIQHGASINGSPDTETPLIGAASLGVAEVATVLIEAGADIHATALFGATALHWASYMGLDGTVCKLIAKGGEIERKCTEFKSTPLFWAVHGIHFGSTHDHSGKIAVVKILIEHGADKNTANFQNYSVQQLARDTGNTELINAIA